MKQFLLSLLMLFSSPSFAEESVELVPENTIVLAGVIGNNMFGPVMDILDKLSLKTKEIDIIISSPGGSVTIGNLLIDRMEQMKHQGFTFRCVVRDVAASMAFQLLLHCNERYAPPRAFLLWHPVRIFMQGVLTAEMSKVLMYQLALADDVAIADLKKYLPMKETVMMWHFLNETLHQAYNLHYSSPGFFKAITNDIINLRPEAPALNTASLGSMFDYNQVIYIHERFVKGVQ